MRCARWSKGRDKKGDLFFGFRSTHRPGAVRPVLLPERSQSWRVKSLRACVIPAAQASSGGGGVGEGEGAVCVKREEREPGMLEVRKASGLEGVEAAEMT